MKKLLEKLQTHKKQTIAIGAVLGGLLCLALVLIFINFPVISELGVSNDWDQSALGTTINTATDNEDNQAVDAGSKKEEDSSNNTQTKKDDQSSSTDAPNGKKENTSSNSTGTSNSKSSGTSESHSSGSDNGHTHVWKDHTATKQVWVSNFVTVPDYETKTIQGAQLYTQHSDGKWYSDGATYWFYTDADYSSFKSLLADKIRNEGYVGNYVNRSKTEKVQVGSHQEDQGSYKTETYVDYQYCDCGAKK